MFKLISVIFTTGVAVGAASVLIAIRRGHMHLEPNQPETASDEDAATPQTADESAGNNGATTTEPVTVRSERLSS